MLAEIEKPDLVALLTACEQIRWRWGYPHQIDLWIGDGEHFLQALAEFNDHIEAKAPDTREGLYLSPPSDFEESRRDQLYLQTIRSLVSPSAQGGKRLLIGDNRRLRAHLQNVPPDIRKVDEVPALAALAYAAHTILGTTPWLRFCPTRRDGFSAVDLFPWDDHIAPQSWEDDEAWFGEDEYDDRNDV